MITFKIIKYLWHIIAHYITVINVDYRQANKHQIHVYAVIYILNILLGDNREARGETSGTSQNTGSCSWRKKVILPIILVSLIFLLLLILLFREDQMDGYIDSHIRKWCVLN